MPPTLSLGCLPPSYTIKQWSSQVQQQEEVPHRHHERAGRPATPRPLVGEQQRAVDAWHERHQEVLPQAACGVSPSASSSSADRREVGAAAPRHRRMPTQWEAPDECEEVHGRRGATQRCAPPPPHLPRVAAARAQSCGAERGCCSQRHCGCERPAVERGDVLLQLPGEPSLHQGQDDAAQVTSWRRREPRVCGDEARVRLCEARSQLGTRLCDRQVTTCLVGRRLRICKPRRNCTARSCSRSSNICCCSSTMMRPFVQCTEV
mmetsp:Transcript_131179/g.331196  ORF Transcript_131179/g.331196 Transcript_131179/m.331196 type:complete len:263 (-) Transcript_131179:650-1438(-)